jgi:hypothetical protein
VLLQQTAYLRDKTMISPEPRKLFRSIVETLEQGGDISTTSDEEYAAHDDAEQVKNIHDQEDTWLSKDHACRLLLRSILQQLEVLTCVIVTVM